MVDTRIGEGGGKGRWGGGGGGGGGGSRTFCIGKSSPKGAPQTYGTACTPPPPLPHLPWGGQNKGVGKGKGGGVMEGEGMGEKEGERKEGG